MTLPVFKDYTAWEEYFDRRTGADAPYLYSNASMVTDNMPKVRAFYTRVLEAYFHPNSTDRAGFIAQVGRSRSIAAALRTPSTYPDLVATCQESSSVFTTLKIDTSRILELANQVTDDTLSSKVHLAHRDLRLFEEVTSLLERGTSDVNVSPYLASLKAKEKDLNLFRVQVQRAGSTDWMRHPYVTTKLRAARRIGRPDEEEAIDAGDLPPNITPVGAPARPAAAAPLAADEPIADLTDEQTVLADQYLALVTASRLARADYETKDPVLATMQRFKAGVDKAFAATGVQAWVAAMRAAESARGKRGQKEGSELERDVWPQCQDCVRVASSRWLTSGSAASCEGFTPIEAAEKDGVLLPDASPLVLVRNVECFQGKRLIGELDGLLVDTRTNQAACVLEVKKTPSDLSYARAQRNRLANALRLAQKKPDDEAAAMRFRVKGVHATIWARLATTTPTWPTIDTAFFAPFASDPVHRWLFVTNGDLNPEVAPVSSKIAHVVTRELSSNLAASNFVMPAEPTPQDAAAAVAALSDGDLIQITKSVHIAWAKSCGTPDEDDLRFGAGKLRAEGWASRLPVTEGGFVVPLVVWSSNKQPQPQPDAA